MGGARRGLAVFVCIVLGSCSWATVRVPDRPPERELECPSAAPVADTVGAAVTLGLAGLMFYGARTSGRDEFGAQLAATYVGIPLGIVGVALTLSAIHGHTEASRCGRMKRQQAALFVEEAARQERREVLSEMARRAAVAARDGDCARAAAIAAKVETIDRDFHASVVVRDAAIARCLAPTAPETGQPPPDAGLPPPDAGEPPP